MTDSQDEWLWGWDPTPGIVSVWAAPTGRAVVWRRSPDTGALIREDTRFRPWLLLDRLDDLLHLGAGLAPDGVKGAPVTYRELSGPGQLRFLVSADDARVLTAAVLTGASRRLGRRIGHLNDMEDDAVFALPSEEQYLVATGRTYFRDLSFDHLRRFQFDLETTGLDASRDRIFMAALRYPSGETEALEVGAVNDAGEADLIRRLVARVREVDPDVIENHNLHGFDLPFLERRARRLGIPLPLGRLGTAGLRQRPARRGVRTENGDDRRVRFMTPGRELIDTLDAVRRYDYTVRDLPSYGLKSVAKYLGVAAADREYIRGAERLSRLRRSRPPDTLRRRKLRRHRKRMARHASWHLSWLAGHRQAGAHASNRDLAFQR